MDWIAFTVDCLRAYQANGGNLASARVSVTDAVEQIIAHTLANYDVPGPDAIIDPQIRRAVRSAVNSLFDTV